MSEAVLLVDDERNVLQALKRLLREEDCELLLADGGAAAVEILNSREIAVIVCDQRMPGLTGAEVLAEAYRLQPDAIRITLTGHTDVAAAQASVNKGHVAQFLFKPWDDAQVRTIVRNGIATYLATKERHRLEQLVREQKKELEAWNHRLEEQVREQTEELRAQNQDLLELHHRLDQSLRDTVKLVAGIMEAHSPNLGIHCQRVAELAETLAEQVGMSGDEIRDVAFAAQLHDIGHFAKTSVRTPAVAAGIGNGKPLRPVSHTDTAHALLSQVSGFEKIADTVRHLHENYDGTGIPDGLKREEIPLSSRVVAIANAYIKAAFSLQNPANFSHQAGCQALLRGKGLQFDSQLVDLLIRYFGSMDAAAHHKHEVEISSRRLQPGMVLSRPIHSVAGLLMLNESTWLTPELIDSINRLGDVDPCTRSVFVQCTPEGQDPQEETATLSEPGTRPAEVCDSQNARPVDDRYGNRTPACTDQRRKHPSKSCEVLVVDDSLMLCNALKRELHTVSMSVVSTDSGWKALELIGEHCFDAAIIDLMMPAMPGDVLVSRLEQESPQIPVIILTGNATREHVAALARKPNVAAILVKPWEHDRLVSAITGAIARSRMATTE